MKILITGANGMLGSDLQEVLVDYDVIATGSKDLDISDYEVVMNKFSEFEPDFVINAAAYTAVDDCETHFDDAYAVNAIGPKNLAIACNEMNIPLVHISTDYVFNGEKRTPLVEDDEIGPKSAYGKTKLAGEEFICENMEKCFILRTAWLYGYHGNNFVKTMLSLAENHDEVSVVYDQVGSPTFTRDLALAIRELVEYESKISKDRNNNDNNSNDNSKYGIYHLTNSAECSWYEFTKYFYKLANLDTKVNPVTTEEFPRPAPRPHYSVLSNEKWINAGFKPMRDYKEAVKDYLDMIL